MSAEEIAAQVEAALEADSEAAEVAPASAGPAVDSLVLSTDSFPGMNKMEGADSSVWKCDGAPNWRRLAGFPIYATGQPKLADLDKCIEQAVNKFDEQKAVLWINVRQEPVLYVNGESYSVREADTLQKHMAMNEVFAINNVENDMVSKLKKGDGSYGYFKDLVGEKEKEKFVEVEKSSGKVESVATIGEAFSAAAKKEPKLETSRIPLTLDDAPSEETFDQLVRLLKGHSSAVPVIFNCQGGITRSTTASVIAAIIKEAQLELEFDKMKGVIPDNIIEGLRETKLHPPLPVDHNGSTNALMKGEFPVVLDLINGSEVAKQCKEQVDRIINAAAGAENIRESAVMEKMQFDVASDEWRHILKERIMGNIKRYFMLIAFAMYAREVGNAGFGKTFKSWLDGNDYRDMIESGKSRLEWERKVPDEKIADLKEMLLAENFDAILPQVINKINQLSYKMFNDLPRGDQKCKSMRKLAGRTLLEVLPPKLTVYLESKLGNLANVPDFYDMVGTLSMYGKIPVVET